MLLEKMNGQNTSVNSIRYHPRPDRVSLEPEQCLRTGYGSLEKCVCVCVCVCVRERERERERE